MALPQQQIEGKYEILQKLKEGGMGTIYQVRHRLLGEVRVIKVMRSQFAENEELKQRFLNEARTAIQLKHPNIAALHDLSLDEEGRAYIVMEYIDGRTLDEILAIDELPSLQLTLEIAHQTLIALDYLHSKAFVHRDIAPDNLMLTRDVNGQPLVKLIDLGIAKMLEADSRTETGVFLGKIRYSAPEHFESSKGSGKVDRRSDLYSFAIVLYELLTGAFPIVGETTAALIAGHLFHPPRPFEETDPRGRVPNELRRIILQALEKEADGRPATAAEFRAVIQEAMGRLSRSTDVTQDVETTLKLTTTMVEQTVKISRPGSTQNRLDAQFGLGPTQPPQEVSDGASSTEISVEKLRAHASKVEALMQKNLLDEAEGAIEEGERIFGADLRWPHLRQTLSERRKKEAEWAQEMARAAAKVEDLLAQGALEEADSELFRAEKIYQNPERFHPLRHRLEELQNQRREQRSASLLAQAEALCEADELDQALAVLHKLLITDPQNETAHNLQRQVQLSQELSRIRAQVDAGELDAAQNALAPVRKSHGEDPAVEALAQEIQAKRRDAEVSHHLDRATTQLEEGRFEQALGEAGKALELDPESSAAKELRARIEETLDGQAREEERRKAALRARDEAQSLLDQGQLSDAAQRIGDAAGELGERDELVPLAAEIEKAVEKLTRELAAAQELVAQELFQEACPALEAILERDAQNPRVLKLLDDARAGLQRQGQEAEHARVQTEAIREVDALLVEGRPGAAAARLQAATAELGDGQGFKHLKARIETCQAEVEELVSSARQLMDAQRYDAACQKLERARHLDRDHEELQELLDGARQGASRQQEELQRGQELTEATHAIEIPLAQGELAQASQELRVAVDRFGDSQQFKHIKARIQTIAAEVQDLVDEAHRLARKKRYDEARQRLDRVLELDRQNRPAQELLDSLVKDTTQAPPAIPEPVTSSTPPEGTPPPASREDASRGPAPSSHEPPETTRTPDPTIATPQAFQLPPQGGAPAGEGFDLFSRWQTWVAAAVVLVVLVAATWWALARDEEQGELASVELPEPDGPVSAPGSEVETLSTGDRETAGGTPATGEAKSGADAGGVNAEPATDTSARTSDPPPRSTTQLQRSGERGSPTAPARETEPPASRPATPSVQEAPVLPDPVPPAPPEEETEQSGDVETAPSEPDSAESSTAPAGTDATDTPDALPDAGLQAALPTDVPSEPIEPPAPSRPIVLPGQLINPCPGGSFPDCVPPRLLSRLQPVYPRAARRRNIEATLVLYVLVDEKGKVTELQVAEGERAGFGLKEAAIEAAKKATYRPANVNGIPVKAWLKLPAMNFTMR